MRRVALVLLAASIGACSNPGRDATSYREFVVDSVEAMVSVLRTANTGARVLLTDRATPNFVRAIVSEAERDGVAIRDGFARVHQPAALDAFGAAMRASFDDSVDVLRSARIAIVRADEPAISNAATRLARIADHLERAVR